jgi:hypothetical protein
VLIPMPCPFLLSANAYGLSIIAQDDRMRLSVAVALL